jgi:tungstate transport system substrate-binding protein
MPRSSNRRARLVLALVVLVTTLALVLSACASQTTTGGEATKTAGTEKSAVIIASTTSTQDSGLFDVLIPAFEKDNPQYTAKVIAVGSGEALKLGKAKEADVLLVHAKPDEIKFVAEGHGKDRKDVMYNKFLIVGPKADPAKISGETSAATAFKKIADTKSTFVSRADDSGTNKKELQIWKAAETSPTPPWYLKTGQGMGETLRITSEKQGYTLTDEATYLTMKDKLSLVPLAADASGLQNQYGVIVIPGAKNEAGGQAFADWITGPQGQAVIAAYGVERFGKPLFTANAPK